MLRSFFLSDFAGYGDFNNDPTVWLDVTRPPQKYICKYKKLTYNHINFKCVWYSTLNESKVMQ
jgi:capsule polysaccharide modification protein KpsS